MSHEQAALAVFENYKIRRSYDEVSETWFFSVVDVVAALIQQPDYQTARKYWNKLKELLAADAGIGQAAQGSEGAEGPEPT
jgi:hypothetical protein